MKLTGFHIDGFGRFRDARVGELPPGLTVLLGANESGKSTTLAFLRQVLFGFPDGRSKEPAYPPLAGGSHGGRLFLASTTLGQEIVIGRRAGARGGKVTVTVGGTAAAEADVIPALLGGVNREVFQSIYAFGLAELQTFDSLAGDSLRAALYAASLGGGLSRIPAVEKSLAEDAQAIFSRRASKPLLNERLRELEEVRGELREAAAMMDEYARLTQAAAECDAAIRTAQGRSQSSRARLDEIRSLRALAQHWIEFRQAEAELAGFPPGLADFPESGGERLEAILARLSELDGEAKEAGVHLADERRGLEVLAADPRLLQAAAAIERLRDERPVWLRIQQELPAAERTVEDIEPQIGRQLALLGPGWTRERAAATDVSLAVRNEVRVFQQKLDEAREAARNAEGELRRAEGDRDRCRLALDAETRALELARSALPVGDELQLRTSHAQLRRLREALQERRALAAGAQQPAVQPEHAAALVRTLVVAACVILALAAAGLGAGVGALAGGLAAGAALLGLGIVALLVPASAWQGIAQRAGAASTSPVSPDSQPGRAQEIDREIVRLHAALACTPEEQADVELVDERLRLTERNFSAATEIERRKQEAERAHAAADVSADKARTEADRQRSLLAGAETAWRAWLAAKGFGESLRPEGAADALTAVAECVRLSEERTKAVARAAALRAQAAAFRHAVDETAAQLGMSSAGETELTSRVAAMVQALDLARSNATKSEESRARIAEFETAARVAQGRRDQQSRDLADLLTRGQAADTEAFRHRARLSREWQETQARLRQAERSLATLAPGKGIDELRVPLEAVDADAQRREEEALAEQLAEGERSLEGLRQARAEHLAKAGLLASAEDVARLRLHEESILEAIRGLAADWRRLVLAAGLLREARRRYERDSQPAVVREASAFFRAFTGGRYAEVVAPVGEERVEAVDSRGGRVPAQALSRGTAEQLYLSLRFGYAVQHARRGEPLPLIMDDILVNFDPERAAAAAQAIGALAGQHQVLFFTCHPETAALLTAACPDAALVRVEDGVFLPR